MMVTSPAEVEERLTAILDRYRPELVDGTIYQVPAWVWPGATGHDYFAALKRNKNTVGLYLIIADRYPRGCRPGLRRAAVPANRPGHVLVLQPR